MNRAVLPRTLLAGLAGLAGLVACQRDDAELGSAPADTAPAVADVRLPEERIEGNYALVEVDGAPLPATLEQQGECRLEISDAGLRVEAGRFAYQHRVREICRGVAGEPVLRSAGGTYSFSDPQPTFTTDLGTAFERAHGTADSTAVMWTELTIAGRVHTVHWTFRRHTEPQVPLPAGDPPRRR